MTQVETLCKKYFCPSRTVKEEQKTELNDPEPSSEKVSIIHEEEPISINPEEESSYIHEEIAIDIEQSLSKKNSGKRSKKPNVDEIWCKISYFVQSVIQVGTKAITRNAQK